MSTFLFRPWIAVACIFAITNGLHGQTSAQETPPAPAKESLTGEVPFPAPEGNSPQEANLTKEAGAEPPKKDEPAEDDQPKPEPVKPEPAKPEPPKPAEPKKLPNLGSTTSPMLPGQPWRVHDIFRPRPRKVSAPVGEVTSPPPGDAVVLFGGDSLQAWAHHDREDSAVMYEAQWTVADGHFEIKRGNGDLYTIENFGDVQLHIEWMVPEGTRGTSQGKGNSGIKFLGLYEVQILDSFDNMTYADGQAGSIYGQYPPDVNVSRPAGEWQTYDIIFEMPKFEESKLVSPGYITVLHNGVLVHHRRELAGITGMRSPGKFSQHPPAGPIMLQDHGNPIRFRNIWARHLN